MEKKLKISLALGISSAVMLFVTAAQAQYNPTYTQEVVPQNDACYRVIYHRQVDLVNPQGILRQGPSTTLQQNIIHQRGGFARDAYNPAVYQETRSTLSPEYYSMRPVGCPRRFR